MAKSTSRPVATAAAKIKTSVYLSAESFERLGACCLKEGWTQSEVVTRLIDRHLKGYYVSVRGDGIGDSPSQPSRTAPATNDDRRDSAAESTDTAGAAA